jgi:Flp pilus assembly protein TadG
MPIKDKRSGSALVLAALFLIVLIPMVGLAVDGTNVYLMRNQIQNALNAAVLAGNRSLSLGMNPAEQTAALNRVANMTFSANISGMSPNLPTPTPSFSVSSLNQIITVSGSVSASLPLMLMELIPTIPSQVNISVTASSSRRSVNIMMVLDHSQPMAVPLAQMQADAVTFVNMFVNGTDNIGLVTFTAAPYVADPLPNQNFQSNVPNDINGMTVSSNTYTNGSAAVSEAWQQLQNLGQPGALNVIVLFTEEFSGAFTGNFFGLVSSGTPCSQTVSPLNGVLFSNFNPLGPPRFTFIGGLADPTSLSVIDTPDTRAAPGCTGPQPSNAPGGFISGMPTSDVYGNSTTLSEDVTGGPANLSVINSTNIASAGESALDDAANRIRGDATLPATIFVIGLTVATPGVTTQPDSALMLRVANDPSSPSYNSSQPSGQYILAPNTATLQSAFTGIASQVLKLAQ